jgi:predicted ATP-binding protein involved in virulence
MMKLKRLSVMNFRAFENLEIEFGDKLTLLVGENGSGKTSVLDSIAVGLGSVLSLLPEVNGISFRKGDIKQENGKLAPFTQIMLRSNKEGVLWNRIERKKGQRIPMTATRIGLVPLKRYIEEVVLDPWRKEEPFVLPVFSYYGVGRALLEVPFRRRGFPKSHDRFESLNNCLNANSRFKSAFVWFYNKENEELRKQKEKQSFQYKLPELEAVRKAITTVFPEISNPHIMVNPLKFAVKYHGELLDIAQLSDGYKTLLSLVIDLASRMAMANPQLEDPLAAEAIVMIDEIDLHLHPEWQSRVIGDLLRTFPGTQFIVTTHSPYILESINTHLQRFKIDGLKIKDKVIREVLPISPDSVSAWLLEGSTPESLLETRSGLLDDRLVHPFNKITRLFDQMRAIEWEARPHD